ncbi:MAG TPA: hypothetical protein HPP83_02175 [Candidatus Hydrogenedentes bacterium]|nr:hypothetical protein [Candidatus Hydrogenedentota bacterium]
MKHNRCNPPIGRQKSLGTRREQALCIAALESGACDGMTDKEWVTLCEEVATEDKDAPLLPLRAHIEMSSDENP